MKCNTCLGVGLVRINDQSKVVTPWLPKRLREIDKNEQYLKTAPCPACEARDNGTTLTSTSTSTRREEYRYGKRTQGLPDHTAPVVEAST